MKTNKIKEKIQDAIGPAEVAAYYTAPSDYRLAAYEKNGGVVIEIGPDLGNEIAEDERPISYISCPGVGNTDTSFETYFATDLENGTYRIWDTGEIVSESRMIELSCETGDNFDDIEMIAEKLEKAK